MGGLTHCLAPTIMNENELRIPALDHSEFPSDAIGNIFSRARGESELGFHHFDFLNVCTTGQRWARISRWSGWTHSSISCGDSEPLFVLLKPHTVVGKRHVRRNENEIRSTIYVERRLEWSARHSRRESNEENNVPAGLSIYPQENGSCIEAWVPRMSKFTAISIESEGWFCISPENRRHNPSATCCGDAIVAYPSPPLLLARHAWKLERICGWACGEDGSDM